MSGTDRSREQRLRRFAVKRGMIVRKSLVRDTSDKTFGQYVLIDANGTFLIGHTPYMFSAKIEEIEAIVFGDKVTEMDDDIPTMAEEYAIWPLVAGYPEKPGRNGAHVLMHHQGTVVDGVCEMLWIASIAHWIDPYGVHKTPASVAHMRYLGPMILRSCERMPS